MEFKTAGAQFFIIDDVLFKDFRGLKEFPTDPKFTWSISRGLY